MLRSGHLNATGGEWTPRFEEQFAAHMGMKFAVAVNSGSAAVHAALAAVGLKAGDEVVTTSITDMGAVLPIVFEGGVPVFCDVDPDSGNVSSDSIRAVLTSRTRAVIATHLFGQMADIEDILAECRARGIAVIEDAAQAFLASDRSRIAGSIGDFGCFSFQQGKHMTTGEGGAVVCADESRDRLLLRFVTRDSATASRTRTMTARVGTPDGPSSKQQSESPNSNGSDRSSRPADTCTSVPGRAARRARASDSRTTRRNRATAIGACPYSSTDP